ncbi:MAG TPA: VWA domain-containing protein [Candidatus Binataceae bacterium]|nr:VWA domain-containing protein [Candidatus Binataceae bacterium]
MREQLLRFVAELRGAGVRISIAETLDAMRAVAAAGLQRGPMREALAASLIKDEADRPTFDRTYAQFFRRSHAAEPREPEHRSGARAARGGNPQSGAGLAARPTPEPETSFQRTERKPPEQKTAAQTGEPRELRGESETDSEATQQDGESDREAATGIETTREARLAAVERARFEDYSELDYETARDSLAILIRRFRVRLGRRLRMARRGRIDFRRTIRAAIQHGGALIDLRFRSRRPRRVDLLILADISGSVRYAATLMLELAAGVHASFRRVRSFVFIDHLAEAGFEDGHLVMTPALDPYARSDFGRVLGELWERRDELLGPATLVIIMGDGRNNRRPARADLVADIAHRCRAVYWLNPEAAARWGTGDSAISQYARHVTALVPAQTLHELEGALSEVF